LADLSDRNQVILFTHHGQIVEEAKKIIDSEIAHLAKLADNEPESDPGRLN
jgi:uncharacterized protein YhaN